MPDVTLIAQALGLTRDEDQLARVQAVTDAVTTGLQPLLRELPHDAPSALVYCPETGVQS